jgi:ABC-type branched-subunit amino acid transport system ATPase component
MNTPMLETRGLYKAYGALIVANSVDFRLERGTRHALIGPNGAGKTTFIELVTGALQPSAGQIHLDGTDITHLPQAARVKRGLVRTFQITALFRRLSIMTDGLAIDDRSKCAAEVADAIPSLAFLNREMVAREPERCGVI